MTRRTFNFGFLFISLSLLVASAAFAQDWPQWRGPNRDGKVTGFTAPSAWPKTLDQKWKVEVGLGDSTPALVGEKLNVFAEQGTDEVTLCLDAATGKQIWQDKYPPHTTISNAPARHGQGPRSSPAVAEGKVVTFDFAGNLSCLDAGTGKVLWRKDFKADYSQTWPQFYVAMSPIIANGMCIAHIGGRDKGALMALDLATGEPKWQWTGDSPAYSSPVLAKIEATPQIVEESNKFLNGIDVASGKLLWQSAFAGRGMSYNAATPIVDGNTIICTGHGTKAFTISKDGDKFSAKELWSNEQAGTQFNTPVLKDGKLYGMSNRGNFYCMDAKDGKVLWTDSTKHDQFCAIVDAGSVLLALPSDGQLLVLKPNDQKYEEIAKYKVSDGKTYAYPVAAGSRIYIKDKDSVTLFVIGGQTPA